MKPLLSGRFSTPFLVLMVIVAALFSNVVLAEDPEEPTEGGCDFDFVHVCRF